MFTLNDLVFIILEATISKFLKSEIIKLVLFKSKVQMNTFLISTWLAQMTPTLIYFRYFNILESNSKLEVK